VIVGELVAAPDGTLRGIYSDELADVAEAIGTVSVARASHVEPADGGGWRVDLSPSGGPVLGPYHRRGEALAAETEWLRSQLGANA
jgi:hypothetical protein